MFGFGKKQERVEEDAWDSFYTGVIGAFAIFCWMCNLYYLGDPAKWDWIDAPRIMSIFIWQIGVIWGFCSFMYHNFIQAML